MGCVAGWGGARDWAGPVGHSARAPLGFGTGLQVGGMLCYTRRPGCLDRAGSGRAGLKVGGALGFTSPAAVRIELVQEGRGARWAGREVGGALGLPRPRRCRGCIPGSLAGGGGAPRLSLQSPLGAGVGTGRSWERGRGGPR